MKETRIRIPSHNLHTDELFDRIRKRLGVTEDELPKKTLKNYFRYLNETLLDLIMDNPEGFNFMIGKQLNGVLAVSKHMPKEMRDSKFDTWEKILDLQNKDYIPDSFKKKLLKRYATAITRRVAYDSLKQEERRYHINPHSFFYTYRFMWFNSRNCKKRKSKCFEFGACTAAKSKLEKRIRRGEDYFEYTFDDFTKYKIKPVL